MAYANAVDVDGNTNWLRHNFSCLSAAFSRGMSAGNITYQLSLCFRPGICIPYTFYQQLCSRIYEFRSYLHVVSATFHSVNCLVSQLLVSSILFSFSLLLLLQVCYNGSVKMSQSVIHYVMPCSHLCTRICIFLCMYVYNASAFCSWLCVNHSAKCMVCMFVHIYEHKYALYTE